MRRCLKNTAQMSLFHDARTAKGFKKLELELASILHYIMVSAVSGFPAILSYHESKEYTI